MHLQSRVCLSNYVHVCIRACIGACICDAPIIFDYMYVYQHLVGRDIARKNKGI